MTCAAKTKVYRVVATVAGLAALALPLRAAAEPPDPCFNHADGALCNDGNPCTTNDICTGGWCRGTVAPNGTDCTDGNLCTTMDRCVLGLCVGQVVPEGAACDDGNKCTTGERCTQGLCVPLGSLQCDDNVFCTQDLCLPAQGCIHNVVLMCMEPDGGQGGQGGQPGQGGQGGGAGGPARDADAEDGSVDSAPPFDAGVPEDAADAALMPDAAGGDAAVDAPDEGVRYEVEGGALLCSLRPHASGRLSALWWLACLGLGSVVLRRLRRRR